MSEEELLLLDDFSSLADISADSKTDNRDRTLILLSRTLSNTEVMDSNFMEKLSNVDSDVINVLSCYSQSKDDAVRYLANQIVSRFLYHCPEVYRKMQVIEGTIKTPNQIYNEQYISHAETILMKMKNSNTGVLLNPVYKMVIRKCIDFASEKLITCVINVDTDSSDMICITHLVLVLSNILNKEFRIQGEFLCSQKNIITLPSQGFPKLFHSFFDFVNCLVYGNIKWVQNNTKMYIIWRHVIKSLCKILDITEHSEKKDCLQKQMIPLYQKVFNGFLSPSFQQELVFIKENFHGPILGTRCSVLSTLSYFVMEEATGRKLIIFLFKHLLRSDLHTYTPDHLDLTISSILYLLNKFSQIKMDAHISQKLISVFIEQDDQLIQILFYLLRLYLAMRAMLVSILESFNPHMIFTTLLDALFFDEGVLLDWLISQETSLFSIYLNEYLKVVKSDFESFTTVISQTSCAILNNFIDTPTKRWREDNVEDTDEVDLSEREQGDSGEEENIDFCDKMEQSLKLVDYSSSSSDDEGEDGEQLSKEGDGDRLPSCLIRLNLKLGRLKDQNLLQKDLFGLVEALDDIEGLFESNYF